MARIFNPDIRQRLWLTLALLAASTLFVGGIAWYALDRAGTRLEKLHSQTLVQVARALSLSKQSSDIATSAPFLLNLKSRYQIEREGDKLLRSLEPVLTAWPSFEVSTASPVYTFEPEITEQALGIKMAITDLVAAVERLSAERDHTTQINSQLARLERLFYKNSTDLEMEAKERRIWLVLQGMANELVGAGHSQNLLGVGEHRRSFQRIRRSFLRDSVLPLQRDMLARLERLSYGENGLFEVRRRELAHKLVSQNALFRIQHHASTINDIADQFSKNAEKFLSEERLKTATSIDFAKVVILVAGLGSVVVALAAAVFVSGYVTGNIKAIAEAMQRLAQGDRSSRLRRKELPDDEIGKLHHSFRMFRANALRLDRSNRQLHQKNALFEKIFDNISEGIAITNDSGHLTAANPNFADVLRLEPSTLKGKPSITDLLAQTDYARQAKEAGIGNRFSGFVELQNDSGQSLEVRCSRLPDGGGIWLFSDATERRQMDNRLRQIQHIESLGKVAGEVAHDFGNVLSTITANLHLLESDSGKIPRKTLLQRIGGATELGTSLTQRLLAFARKQRLKPEVVELNDLVEGLTDLVGIGLKTGVDLQAELADEDLCVCVDPGQLESAILNLCLNASQAIEGEGQIRITVSREDQDTAMIKVSDTGCGMEEAIAARVLEPFYTARKDGEGTGLGLSMVYGFIKQTGGDIRISSTKGQGTSVCLSLPLCARPAKRISPAAKGTALVVEDVPEELKRAAMLLQDLGYQVTTAACFADAMQALDCRQSFDVLLTDLQLDDGRSGWDIAARCLDEHANTQVVIASGRMPASHPYSDGTDPRVTCLEKPLSRELLARVLQNGPASALAAAGA